MPSNTINVKLIVNVRPLPVPVEMPLDIVVNVLPANITEQTLVMDYPFVITTNPIELNITRPVTNTSYGFLGSIMDNYVDLDRELKTLLNFGEDRQNVVLSYRTGSVDTSGVNTLQLKLLKPIPDEIIPGYPAFISREVSNTVIDTMRVRFGPDIDDTPYLRPRNTNVKIRNKLGKTLKNITLKLLSLETGSEGAFVASNNVSFEDEVYRKWYSFDFNSSELNIDFTDYNNFVYYGSAAMRLEAFKQKIKEIEYLTQESMQFVGSVFTGSLASAGSSYILEKSATLSKQKETLIRSFDRYEQYLYFTPSGTVAPYTASAWYADGGTEYNEISYWPKDPNNVPFPINSLEVENWFNTQIGIAQRFDEFNENNLVNTIPDHVVNDEESEPYLTFVSMIGHFFDTIKPYVDQFPYIYNRYTNPNEDLSKDLVIEIAESVGFKLPTLDSIYNLSGNVVGTQLSVPRRDFTVESHKRLLHNLPFFAKSKGTRTALMTLIKSFGINESLIGVRESGTGYSDTGSLYVFDEYTNGINFDGSANSFISIPVSASRRSPSPRSLQMTLNVAHPTNQTIVNANTWKLNAATHPTIPNLGRFELVSGSNAVPILTSSYDNIFGDDSVTISLRTYDTGSHSTLFVARTEAEDIIFSSSMSETGKFIPLWNTSPSLVIGNSGSSGAGNYTGTVDEIRLWGINLSNEMVLNNAFDPGSNAGDSYSDASDYLYVQLSFDKIHLDRLPSYVVNESPYKGKDGSPSLDEMFMVGLDLSSFTRHIRSVRQLLPDVGSSLYVTKKVHVASPPVFNNENLSADGVKQLSRTRSIVSKTQKPIQRGRNKVSITTSPTSIINQNIIRTLGLENINALMGSPIDSYKKLDKSLDVLKRHYSRYYYVDVNINQYIRILDKVNSVLEDVVEYFIPSKATLLKGVTIEPNILERVKISPLKELRVYGKNTRKTTDGPESLLGYESDYGATYGVSDTINAVNTNTAVGGYSTYETDIERSDYVDQFMSADTLDMRALFSSSVSTPVGTYDVLTHTIRSVIDNTVAGQFEAYLWQHEDWINSKLVETGLKAKRQASVEGQSITDIDALVSTASGSMSVTRKNDMTGYQNVIDLQHLDWATNKKIDESYRSGSAEYITNPFMPRPRARLALNLLHMNKIKYNDKYGGSDGAEPYNRVYPRKLFDYEINTTRRGGITSLYKKALYEIPPSSDFRELGSYTYFNSPSGIYYYPKIIYTPTSYRHIQFNQNWDGMQFVSASTWEYGHKYNTNDVVYQDVQFDSPHADKLESVVKHARKGNGRYYVFKANSLHKEPLDQSAWVSGSVPTYTPPSLDQTNWIRVAFSPNQINEPRRIVFDTFTVPDPSLNNYVTTTINVNKIIDVPHRYIDLINAGNINPYSYVTGEMPLQNIAALLAIQASNASIRIRLYRTLNARDNDISRPINVLPEHGAGVLLDTLIAQENVSQLINPIVTLIAGDQPPLGKIYYTIDNTSNTLIAGLTLLMYYFAIQIEPRVPFGYLRKHYRFFRDNSTATKRRNYLGCKNTIDTTIDGNPPVQITISEGTDISISPTRTSEEILTGGGGTLDVT